MGLHKSGIQAFLDLFKSSSTPSNSVVTFGTQTFDSTLSDALLMMLKRNILLHLEESKSAPQNQTIDGNLLFRILGFKQIVNIDVLPHTNETYVHDLCKPIPKELHQKFDMIFDGSTGSHCLNRLEMLSNAICLLKTGGRVIHSFGCDLLGGTFGLLTPQILTRFYEENGFSEIKAYCCHTKHLNGYFEISGDLKLALPIQDLSRNSILFTAVKSKQVDLNLEFIEWQYELSRRTQNDELDWSKLEGKKAVVWGVGSYFKNILAPKLKHKVSINLLALIDEDETKQNQSIDGISVVNPTVIAELRPQVVIIGSANKRMVFERLISQPNISSEIIQNTYDLYKDFFELEWNNRVFESHSKTNNK